MARAAKQELPDEWPEDCDEDGQGEEWPEDSNGA